MRKRSMVAGLLAASAALLGFVTPAAAAPAPAGGAQPFIIGGGDATETYPFMASMQTKDGQHNCGASLVAEQWLVTAGHCVTNQDDSVEDPAQWQYRIGTTDRTKGGEVVAVDKFVAHPKWSWQGPGNYDIAVAHLAKPVKAAPIAIASAKPKEGAAVREIGWGLTCPTRGCGDAPVKLQQVDTKIAAASACGDFDAKTELCMDNQGGKVSACYGDSGGPAVVKDGDKWALVGATSRGQTANCPEKPGIYTDVTAHADWVKQQVGGGKG
ncbi:S1 family peptidase [Amycolatopsis samaneae]|uniref:Serine protease n=1 Tax=Amycolatopsis samaneae TaxID=664691 RepID=A0ABW5GF23_9PSEU